VLPADLVVDATGRGSRTPAWLASLGYSPPAEESVSIDIRYTSQQVRLSPGAVPEETVVIGANPERPGGMALFAYEDDTWVFTVYRYGQQVPPDYDEMVAYAAGFAPSHMVSALRSATLLGSVASFRFPANRRRRYERMRRFPGGLLVIGDALCCFNPIYGQGMSVAALEAVSLRDCLESGTVDLGRRFFRDAARRVDVAWEMAVGSDLALPQVEGVRSFRTRVVNGYVRRVLIAAERDAVVAARFLRVSAFLESPALLMSLPMVFRVFVGGLWRG
jgi:2-polyprenyl-6-methoxyphenol hydroxylase-like FAD-dependent oxidoreductase